MVKRPRRPWPRRRPPGSCWTRRSRSGSSSSTGWPPSCATSARATSARTTCWCPWTRRRRFADTQAARGLGAVPCVPRRAPHTPVLRGASVRGRAGRRGFLDRHGVQRRAASCADGTRECYLFRRRHTAGALTSSHYSEGLVVHRASARRGRGRPGTRPSQRSPTAGPKGQSTPRPVATSPSTTSGRLTRP